MVTFTSQLAGFASGLFIIASRPSEILVVDCSLWSFAIVARWQTGFTGPGETCKIGPSWIQVTIIICVGRNLTFTKKGVVWFVQQHYKGTESLTSACTCWEKRPSSRDILSSRGHYLCTRIRYETLQLHLNTMWPPHTHPHTPSHSPIFNLEHLFKLFWNEELSWFATHQTLCFFFP